MNTRKKKPAVKTPAPAAPEGSTAEELADEFVPCPLGDKIYRLKCSWQALKIASMELRKQGVVVNLMVGLDFRYSGPEMVAPLFFAMALAQHPGLKYADIDSSIDMKNCLAVFDAVATAYIVGMPKAEKASAKNPPEAQAAA